MNIRLSIILACLLAPACYSMTPITSSIDTDTTQESIRTLYWHMRRQLAQHVTDSIRTRSRRAMMAYPVAPRILQNIWTEAQTRMGIAATQQLPLHVSTCDEENVEFRTLYGISTIDPIIVESMVQFPQLYGYVRCNLLHEAAHIKTSNVDHVQKTIVDYIFCVLDDNKIAQIYTEAVRAHWSTIFEIYARLFLSNIDAQNLQEKERHRIEHETDLIMLKNINCEQCFKDYMFFMTKVDDKRIAHGYIGLRELKEHSRTLIGKKCAHHAH